MSGNVHPERGTGLVLRTYGQVAEVPEHAFPSVEGQTSLKVPSLISEVKK